MVLLPSPHSGFLPGRERVVDAVATQVALAIEHNVLEENARDAELLRRADELHEVVARVRQTNQCPILIVSVRGQESDKVSALDAGAADYLTKPFEIRSCSRVSVLCSAEVAPGSLRVSFSAVL